MYHYIEPALAGPPTLTPACDELQCTYGESIAHSSNPRSTYMSAMHSQNNMCMLCRRAWEVVVEEEEKKQLAIIAASKHRTLLLYAANAAGIGTAAQARQ